MRKLIFILALMFCMNIYADSNDLNEVKSLIEARIKIVDAEIKALNVRIKVNKNDSESLAELSSKKEEMKCLEKEKKTVETAISTQKDLQKAIKEYETLKTRSENLKPAIEGIYQRELELYYKK